MPIQGSQRVNVRPGSARATILLVTLLGIVGMHGIGSHGVHGSDTAHSSATASAHHTSAHDATDLTGGAITGSAIMGDAAISESPSGSAPSLLDVCCVAILIGLGFALWVLQRRQSGTGRADRTRPASSGFVPRLRNRGPPSLVELSILRC